MSVKETSFSKKFFNILDVDAMSKISGGLEGDPFDPYFSDKRNVGKTTRKADESLYNSFNNDFLVG
jgi:hypothetical protein